MLMLILLPAVLTVILVVWFTLKDAGKVHRNVVLGVTLPADVVNDAEVMTIQKAYTKRMHLFMWFIILSYLVSVLLLKNKTSIQLIYFSIWITVVLVLMNFVHTPYYRQLKKLKADKGWYVGTTELVMVDTKVSKLKNSLSLSPKWFLLPFAVAAIGIILMVMVPLSEALLLSNWVVALTNVFLAFLLYWSSKTLQRQRTKVYSKNSDINLSLNELERRATSYLCLFVGLIGNVILLITQLYTMKILKGSLTTFSLAASFVSILLLIMLMGVYIYVRKQINEMCQMDAQSIYVDDDKYWINGIIYCNPNNYSSMVNKRFGIGTTINWGTNTGKILGILPLSLGIIILIGTLYYITLLDFSTPVWQSHETSISITYPVYNTSFNIKDIQSVELIDKLPSSYRSNGVATEEYSRGHFTVSGYGDVLAYVYKDSSPYMVIKLSNQTIIYGEKTPEATLALYHQLTESQNKLTK